jgi:hypothetical protein
MCGKILLEVKRMTESEKQALKNLQDNIRVFSIACGNLSKNMADVVEELTKLSLKLREVKNIGGFRSEKNNSI